MSTSRGFGWAAKFGGRSEAAQDHGLRDVVAYINLLGSRGWAQVNEGNYVPLHTSPSTPALRFSVKRRTAPGGRPPPAPVAPARGNMPLDWADVP